MIKPSTSGSDKIRKSTLLLAASLSLAATQSAFAQATAPAPAAPAPSPATPATGEVEEEIIELSPFLVTGEEDQGYRGRDTLAGSRIRTSLDDVGSATSVITKKFLQDTGSRNAEQALVYATNTEVAGQSGNFSGVANRQGAADVFANEGSTISATRVRGLAAADNLRDFYRSSIPWDSYNISRVDLQRGPNSVLFGIGSPAGVINSTVNIASYRDSGMADVVLDNNGTFRISADYNKVLIPNKLAVRVAGLNDNTKYRQKPAFRDDKRIFAAAKWDSNLLKIDGAKTTIRVNFEAGEIERNDPVALTPLDAITPWFDADKLNKRTWTAATAYGAVNRSNSATSNPWATLSRFQYSGGSLVQDFAGPGASAPFRTQRSSSQVTYPANDTSVDGIQIIGIATYDHYANEANLLGENAGAWRAKGLRDSSIFDFYNNLLTGDNKGLKHNFDAQNITLAQTFFNNKLGVEFAYNKEQNKMHYQNNFWGDAQLISVDIVSTLIDGSPNPNVGRAYTVGNGRAGSWTGHGQSQDKRVTAFGELSAREFLGEDSKVAKIIGRHVFTGLWQQNDNEWDGRSWQASWVQSALNTGKPGTDGTTIVYRTYLSDADLSSRTSASGLNLSRIRARQTPASGTFGYYDTDTKAYGQMPFQLTNANGSSFDYNNRPYTGGESTDVKTTSKAIVWQGYMLNGNIVPMFGWREDKQIKRSTGQARADAITGLANFADPEYRLPSSMEDAKNGRLYGDSTTRNKTYSLVVKVPRSLMNKLPGGLGLSGHYTKSSNVQPVAGRRNILNEAVPSPEGETKEIGVTISALDDRLSLKVNRYKTQVRNDNSPLQNWFLTYFTLYQANANSFLTGNGISGWNNYGTSSSGQRVQYEPEPIASNLIDPSQGAGLGNYTQAALDSAYALQISAATAWKSFDLSKTFQALNAVGYDQPTFNDWGNVVWSPGWVSTTADSESKGWEYELTARPIKGLDIAFNASKTDASRSSFDPAMVDLVTRLMNHLNTTDAGKLRAWSGEWWNASNGLDTAANSFRIHGLVQIDKELALLGGAAPELRPWRFNITGNYTFQGDNLKGWNVGGSYRWEDKVVRGFGVTADGERYDVSKKYFGPSEDAVDLWVGYERNLTSKIKWRAQLNVRNAFASKTLIPIDAQPTGDYGQFRIPEPRVISLTNTFSF
ncbi:MAG: TonB-dependent receptor plug domain-containing protein [Opitutaceae bacterium]|nr:TonB-dependent receptor plug domain-containing protein [Opitutaceae bacterium]